jgi:hypothetical protein
MDQAERRDDKSIEKNNPIRKFAIEILRDYWRPLYGAQLFAFLSFLIVLVLSLVIGLFFVQTYATNVYTGLSPQNSLVVLIIILILPALVVYSAFQGSVYGITREILVNGDYFIEFKHIFYYFKKYWWQYFLASLSVSCFNIFLTLLLNLTTAKLVGWGLFLVYFCCNFFMGSFLCLLTPSICAGTSIRKAYREAIHLFRQYYPRILGTFGVVYFILQFIASLNIAIQNSAPLTNSTSQIVLLLVALLVLLISGPPLVVLATILYNSFTGKNTPREMEGQM